MIAVITTGHEGGIVIVYLTSAVSVVVLLLHPKINCMTIPPVVPVKKCRIIPLVVISAIIFPELF
jgi:hypothetical protein